MIKSVKRLGAAVLSAVIMLTAVATPLGDKLPVVGERVADVASAETYGDFQYSVLDDGTVEITKYTGSAEKVDIPEKIDGKSVTSIGDYAFDDCESFKSITIPDSVTSIGDSAFEDCINLKSITIPGSVTSIGEWAFNRCANITSVTIPNSVTSIGNNAFIGCESLTEIKVAAKNVNYASVNGVLFNKDKSKLVFYPGGKIDKNYSIPESVTDIGRCAFDHCISLTSVTIPNSVTSIGDGAFEGCTSLKSIVISDSVTSIGGSVFSGCISLKSIIIPKSVTVIGYEAFGGCLNLRSIDVVEDNSIFASENGVLFDKNKTRLIYYPSGKTDESYEIPNGVVTIDGQAFFCCSNLVSIKLPHSVTEISEYAFFGCTKLKSIIIPSSVTTIWRYAFGYCSGDWWLDKISDFKIYCYSGTAGEQYAKDNGFAYELLDQPTIANVTGFKVKSLTSTNATLQWNKNTSASSYEIEQYKGGKWVNVAKITGNATTSYTVKGLAAGTAGYKFRMRAVKDSIYSDYTSALSVNTNPYGVGGFKCSSKTSTSVTLKWNKGTTASGYQLQQYKDGKWVTIYTGTKATNTSYTVKNLKAGTAGYRFRIRAYKTYGNTKQYGSWSSEAKVNTNPYGVGGFKAKSTAKTSITLGWNKGTTASGYQLQQYKGGKWVTVYTGTKATSTSYTVKSLKSNTSYKFRIRAYKTYGNNKQYGSWSKELTVKTKK